MKHCPNCDATYDEEVIRFCTKDGTPLIEDVEPQFSALPSESLPRPSTPLDPLPTEDDDAGEVTVIRQAASVPAVPPPPSIEELNAAVPPPRSGDRRLISPPPEPQQQ